MIKFNEPKLYSKISDLKKLTHFSSKGLYTKKCEKWLINNIKCKDALLVNSCTSALEMCALLLNIKQNDEIIMPSFTFVSTANAFVLRGGKPVFVDINPNTCNIDTSKIEKAISKKTKAIVVVHYAGISCEMDTIIKIAKKHNLYIIEDAAQAIMSSYKGRPLGSIGDLATLSFHETKNIHCGEGGALLINNPKFIKRAKIIRDKGTNRDLFDQNIVKKYSWVDYGSSYGLSEINAMVLYSQLKIAKKITKKRIEFFNEYLKAFKKFEILNQIEIPFIPKYCNYNGHIFYIIKKKNKRNLLIRFLKKKKINAIFHYIPLHSSPFGRCCTKTKLSMKNTNFVANNLLRLPLHLHLKQIDQIKILKEIKKFFTLKKIYAIKKYKDIL
jgi:dTDP-4-amino-4,6-dideoxygalactose transaminase